MIQPIQCCKTATIVEVSFQPLDHQTVIMASTAAQIGQKADKPQNKRQGNPSERQEGSHRFPNMPGHNSSNEGLTNPIKQKA